MKKSLLFAFLLMCGIAGAQTINFPDLSFKAKLINANPFYDIAKDVNGDQITIDANLNGEIEQSEALQVYELNIWNNGFGSPMNAPFQSLDGIQYFLNLKVLKCGNHSLTSLDVSALTNLVYLECRANSIQSLNVSGLTNLEYIDFEFNQLTSFTTVGLPNLKTIKAHTNQLASLDLSGSPVLNTVECNNNQLPVLDVAAISQLTSLNCSSNQITSLDVSMHQQLSSLSCSNNQMSSLVLNNAQPLTWLNYSDNLLPNVNPSAYVLLESLSCSNVGSASLDLTGFTALNSLSCSGNLFTNLNTDDLVNLQYLELRNSQLTDLDLSHSPNLGYVHISDNLLLESINLHNGAVIEYSGENDFTNNPNLGSICVDEGEQASLQGYFEQSQLPVPVINTNCSVMSAGEFTLSVVRAYPNPSKGIITVDADSAISSLQLYDIQGKMLENIQVNEISGNLDLSGRAAGLYFLTITTDKGVKIEKLIKE
jgi:Leucine-rich repeat (LRR) protein